MKPTEVVLATGAAAGACAMKDDGDEGSAIVRSMELESTSMHAVDNCDDESPSDAAEWPTAEEAYM